MTQKGQRKDKSLFEQSMKIVVNVIKVSSLSLAEISLGSSDVPPERRGSMMTLGTGSASELQPQDPGSQKSKEPGSDSKVLSYLIEPGNGPKSLRVVEDDVNGRAVDFISRVHRGFKKVDN